MSRLFRAAKRAAERLTGNPPSTGGGTGRRTISRRTATGQAAPSQSLAKRLAKLLFGEKAKAQEARSQFPPLPTAEQMAGPTRVPPRVMPSLPTAEQRARGRQPGWTVEPPPVDQAWVDYQRSLAGLPPEPPGRSVPVPFDPPREEPEEETPEWRRPGAPVEPPPPDEPTTGAPPPDEPDEPPLEEPAGGRGAPYRIGDWRRVMVGMRLTPGSSNVFGYYFEFESRTQGILYVTFLGVNSDGSRSGTGQTYAYYDVSGRKYHEFARASDSSAGKAVWDYLRIRGTISGHQHNYRLIQSHGMYVPRKATPEGFRSRAVTARGTGVRGYRRSTLPERLFVTPERRNRPDRGEPDRGTPNRGEPDRGS